MIGPGLYTSLLSTTAAPEILVKPSLVPYPTSTPGPAFSRNSAPSTTDVPLNIAISQWHWILLYSDRMVGISRETEKVVFEEKLPLVSLHTDNAENRPATSGYWASLPTQSHGHSGSSPTGPCWKSSFGKKIGMFGGPS